MHSFKKVNTKHQIKNFKIVLIFYNIFKSFGVINMNPTHPSKGFEGFSRYATLFFNVLLNLNKK